MRTSRAAGAYLNALARAGMSSSRPLPNRQRRIGVVPVQAPVGGWNTRDSLDDMKPEDAVALDNWFPGLGSCSIRGGTTSYATSLGSTVKMLAEFNAGSTRKFIAGANSRIWDISAAGAGVSLASGYTSDIWNWAQFDDASGGARMGLVNGSDAPQIYNGTAVSAMTISGTALTPANLNGINIYKSRSYFWDDRTQDFWYSATNALGGTLTKFPLGRLAGTGGNMLAMGTWSRDSGSGLQDLAVFVLSSGDIFVYAGDNPGDATAWQLQNRYSVGAPINKRAIKKVGSELILVTKAGYVTLSSLLAGGRVNENKQAISSKIRKAAIDAVAAYGSNFGWEIAHYPRKNWLLVNVPLSTTTFHQHVMNTETGAWCRFKNMDAQCWGLFNDLLYFGRTDGTVYLADSGTSDNGTAIVAEGQPAWNYLEQYRASKRVTGIKPVLRSTDGIPAYTINVGFDFAEVLLSTSISPSSSTSSAWDVSDWDLTPWGDDYTISDTWSSVTGDGYAVGSKLKVSTITQAVEWLSTAYLYENGGAL
jgi:hypothetical protein